MERKDEKTDEGRKNNRSIYQKKSFFFSLSLPLFLSLYTYNIFKFGKKSIRTIELEAIGQSIKKTG